ncbi:MAG TPA: TonB-dependent receptor [Xanthomonadales bacterium]|nr:TonB-dependent receptor [Xanthomonadales bacterium]
MKGKLTQNTFALAITAALAATLASPLALAQELALEEILVTAQKREQSLTDVPAAVSAITGETVKEYLSGAQDIRALAARVPGLNIETSNGRTQPRFYLRGLGNIDFDVNANQPVAMIFDEVALENNTLRSLPLFDIERIEVLKGPQGSLFGRNTNAGVIKVDSVKPTFDRNGYFTAAYGSRGTLVLESASNFTLTDTLAMRASIKYQERDEWIDNTVNGPGDDFGGFEEFAWRLQFAWSPTDNFAGNLNLHGFNQDGSDPNVFYANALEVGRKGLRPEFNEEIASNDNQVADMTLDAIGGVLNLKWTFDNELSLTSITGYDTLENFQSADVDGGETSFNPADIGELGKQVFFGVATGDGLDDLEQFTQELRLSGEADNLFWQTGMYYFDEDFDLLNYDFLNVPASALVSQQTTSWAVFGQAEYSFSDAWALTFGARWTDDDKDLQVRSAFAGGTVLPGAISVSDDFFNWDLALSFDASDEWTWYSRLATGSRGPVTLGRFGFVSSAKTEDTISGEIGFKSMLMDGRARWNTSIYMFQNDNQQLTATGGEANTNQLLNADQVNGYGAETELELLISENLTIMTNLSYIDTEIDDPNLRDDLCGSAPTCTRLDPIAGIRQGFFGPVTEVFIDGNPLPRTPEWIFNFILQYTYPLESGDLYFNNDWNYRDDSNLFLHESIEFVQDARWLGGLRAGYRTDSGMDFALVGRNITDEVTVEGGINFLNLTAFVSEPAYWGGEFRINF